MRDAILESYQRWCDAAAAVSRAYARWASAPACDEAPRHGAYTASLDQEAAAATAYAAAMASGQRP